jgi:hypothetical protein
MDSRFSYDTKELLDLFDRLAPFYAAVMKGSLDRGTANTISAARSHFEDLIAEIPYVGPLSYPLPSTLAESAVSLSFYKIMKETGLSVKEAGEVIVNAFREGLKNSPPEELQRQGAGMFSEEFYRIQAYAAGESQKKRFPGDWIFSFLRGKPGEGFDWGWDFTECAILKFYKSQGAMELLPFLCVQDLIISELQATGLERTSTLCDGPVCNFRYRRGRAVIKK